MTSENLSAHLRWASEENVVVFWKGTAGHTLKIDVTVCFSDII